MDVRERLEDALRAEAAGLVHEADRLAAEVMALAGADAEAAYHGRVVAGRARLARGDAAGAVTHMRRAVDIVTTAGLDNLRAGAFHHAFTAYAELRHERPAEEFYQRARRAAKAGTATARLDADCGFARILMGKWRSAAVVLRPVPDQLRHDRPALIRALANRAHAESNLGNAGEARALVDGLVLLLESSEPADGKPFGWVNVGRALRLLGDAAGARLALERARALASESGEGPQVRAAERALARLG